MSEVHVAHPGSMPVHRSCYWGVSARARRVVGMSHGLAHRADLGVRKLPQNAPKPGVSFRKSHTNNDSTALT